MIDQRDWNENPPETVEDALEFAKMIAQEACDSTYAATGERPHYKVKGNSIFIVWPDGMITNEIEIGMLQ